MPDMSGAMRHWTTKVSARHVIARKTGPQHATLSMSLAVRRIDRQPHYATGLFG